MNAIPPAFEILFPCAPVVARARRLVLAHPEGSWPAYIVGTESADLTGLMPASYLHPSELAQAAAFRFAARRQIFLLGRLAAKAALGSYLVESDWTRVELTHGIFGQPLVNYAASHDAEVSLSHSSGFAAAVAFPRECPVAVDVETVDSDRAATVKNELKFLLEEQQWIHSAAVEERAAYVLLWTVREALGKVLRCGITCPLELLAVDKIQRLADGVWESDYRNFRQYKCWSWIRSGRVLSIALPKVMDLQSESQSP